ncbi:O-succinylbenzoate-CoA ligase [Burkholderia lata]|uniref:O-succinylbenzoate-CoA ligase n=1 Tax=Burkholderia lata (strain ATCC 17760 / DSM 23089 / LMG 22485 / NCIMB 9086 / R18194 / 383) TaxID=482957 RepID=A0A6P2TPQ1_BURL3|nr:hypothetical protein [Burkholderia lata]VWC59528.1 O-succinylbenzoate-CoA ligase [Burkholderia lata]
MVRVGRIDVLVRCRPARHFDEATLRRYLREPLASYKHPARIIPIDALPFNGKLMRREFLARL